jgi:surface carbohydrate biosynthesis protein
MQYLLCELKARDFLSAMLVARDLIGRGHSVVLGQWWGIVEHLVKGGAPQGTVLFRTANAIQADQMAQCRDAGHRVIAMDEEGLPFSGAGFLVNIAPRAVDVADRFLLLREQQTPIMTDRFPDHRDKFRVTGSARMDLLKQVKFERRLNKPYLLFNTGFGLVNSVWGDERSAVTMALKGLPQDADEDAILREYKQRLTIERHAMQEVVTLIDWAVKATTQTIVIRPHPSEKAAWWEDRFKSSNRVKVVASSEPGPWIKHATAVIHADSTTGLEAAALGVPCVNISPDPAWSERFMMREVNVTVPSGRSAAEKLRGLLNGGAWPRQDTTALLPGGSAARIADVMADEASPAPHRPTRWIDFQRQAAQKEKFTVPFTEAQHAVANLQIAGSVHQLADSTFLLQPSAPA